MNFLPNTIVIFTATVLRIIEVWVQACQEMISMVYVPTLIGGLEGKHASDAHYHGHALDFRSKDVPYQLREPLKHRAQQILGSDYLVILEQDHFCVKRQKVSHG